MHFIFVLQCSGAVTMFVLMLRVRGTAKLVICLFILYSYVLVDRVLIRVLQAMWLLCTGAREASFRNIKTIAECLADELINAAKVRLTRVSSQ